MSIDDTVPAPPRDHTLLESLLIHDRMLAAGLILVPLVCWAWIVPMARDMYGSMNGPSAWMMTTVWDSTHLLLLFAMWAVMMVGMMLPSASPVLVLYASIARRQPDVERTALRVYTLAGGYLVVWILFGLAATVLQRVLSARLLLSPMMKMTDPAASGAFLLIAGVYQLTPLKRVCLDGCRSPVGFIIRHWRAGRGGAFRMGVEHGVYCLGCCWAMMLLLFVGGVMNLYVIAAVTTFVLLEKLGPLTPRYGMLSGLLLIALGVWTMFR